MKKIVRLTESDLIKLVKRVIKEGEITQDCLKDFKIEIKSHPVYGEYKVATRNDGIEIFFDKENNKWNDTYENKKGKKVGDMYEVGKWKCENGIFVMYDKRQRTFTIG